MARAPFFMCTFSKASLGPFAGEDKNTSTGGFSAAAAHMAQACRLLRAAVTQYFSLTLGATDDDDDALALSGGNDTDGLHGESESKETGKTRSKGEPDEPPDPRLQPRTRAERKRNAQCAHLPVNQAAGRAGVSLADVGRLLSKRTREKETCDFHVLSFLCLCIQSRCTDALTHRPSSCNATRFAPTLFSSLAHVFLPC